MWTYASDDRMRFAFEDDILAGDSMPFKRMRADQFDDLEERRITAEQIAGNQFGLCFIAMFDFLEARFGDGAVPKSVPPQLNDISILISAVRNAFSHKIGTPVWNVKDPNLRRELNVEFARIDLGKLHGQPVHPDQLGGALSVERVWNGLNESLNRHRESVADAGST